MPVARSFTVETDGRLPDGKTLRDAITPVEAEDRTEYCRGQLRVPRPHCAGASEPRAWPSGSPEP